MTLLTLSPLSLLHNSPRLRSCDHRHRSGHLDADGEHRFGHRIRIAQVVVVVGGPHHRHRRRALVGVVVLSGLVGFLFKKYKSKEDPYEANPFDRDAFQRHSAMIPDHFDSDDGHAGAGGMSPEMSEHYQYNNYAPQYESGISAGARVPWVPWPRTTRAARAHPPCSPSTPRACSRTRRRWAATTRTATLPTRCPPCRRTRTTMRRPTAAFANHHAAEHYLEEPGFGQQRSVSPAPQLPPLAAFGGDPYSIAGVGRGQQQNVANPYAHLDRSHAGMGGFVPGAVVPGHAGSASVSSGGDSADRHASISAAEALAAGLAHQSFAQPRGEPAPRRQPRHGRSTQHLRGPLGHTGHPQTCSRLRTLCPATSLVPLDRTASAQARRTCSRTPPPRPWAP